MVSAGGLRIAFFGTPQFAVPTLEALLASKNAVVGIVTRQDRPKGRGQKVTETPVKARAIAAGVPVLQPERLDDTTFLDALAQLRPDLGIVAAYGKILTEHVLAAPRRGLLNVHASLLPRYRGAAPVHRSIINGDPETGVTIMRVVKQLDAGPMLAAVRRAIGPDETSGEIERDLARMGASLLAQTIDALIDGSIVETPQDDSAATYARRLTKDDGIIDWTRRALQIHNLIRGLHPWPHAFTFHHGRRMILLRSTLVPGPAGLPGAVLQSAGDHLHIATGDGALAISELQVEGRRPMTPREFLAGHRLTPGDILTPKP